MYSTSEFRNGLKILFNDEPYIIVEFQHVKPGKGGAFVRTRLKHLKTGLVQEHTFRSGEKVGKPDLQEKTMQFMYRSGDEFHFMDLETYDQPAIRADVLGDATQYLKEELEVKLTFYQNDPIDIELPITVDLDVVHAEASVRGDTATGVTKKVTTETGLDVQVPNFVNQGDTIRVDTRNGSYITRV